MLAAVDELRERVAVGQVDSLGLIVEVTGRTWPLTVLLGRYAQRPEHAADAAAVFHHKVLAICHSTEAPARRDFRV